MYPVGSRGMTLIEMLVVLLIMGLLVSVTVLSTGLLNRRDSDVSATALIVAEDLSRIFEHAGLLAVANNEVLGWSLQDDRQVGWWRWSSGPVPQVSNTGPERRPAWIKAEDLLNNSLLLPDDIELQVNTERMGNPETNAQLARQQGSVPAIVFFPGRELSVFEIHITDRNDGRVLARVWPDGQGKINWGAL